jgi:chaperonin GroES
MKVTTPMRDLMVVEKFEPQKVTASGIILPGAALDSNTSRGVVRVMGPGQVDEKTGDFVEIDVKVGDIVLFHNNAGIKVSEHGALPEEYLLREEDILAIVV